MSKRGENIYKRKDGRWEGRYIKCRTLHGRIQYGYVYGKSYSAVKSKLKETASMPIQTSDSRGTQPTSYSEILKMWLLSAKNHVKESTLGDACRITQLWKKGKGYSTGLRYLLMMLRRQYETL